MEEISFAITRFDVAQQCSFHLRFARKSGSKDATLEFPGIKQKLTSQPAIDELGFRLVQGLVGDVIYEKTSNGWRGSVVILD